MLYVGPQEGLPFLIYNDGSVACIGSGDFLAVWLGAIVSEVT